MLAFDAQIVEVQQLQLFDYLAKINLNDHLLGPFYSVIWVVMLFLIPGVTMGLFANEKAQGTQELLFTSPITVWELVIGKYLAAAVFVALLVGDRRRLHGRALPLRRPGARGRPRRACSGSSSSASPTPRSAPSRPRSRATS